MKIAIVGYSGSGKSTLAGQLGEIFNCPVLYLDKIQFEPNWKERDQETAKKMVKNFLDENSSWVIDGNYTRFYRERRMEEADVIVFMNYSRITCLFQAYKRSLEYKGRTRESMSEGCIEKLDFEFIKWILFDGRSKEKRDHSAETIRTYNHKVAVLKNRKETEIFLKNYK